MLDPNNATPEVAAQGDGGLQDLDHRGSGVRIIDIPLLFELPEFGTIQATGANGVRTTTEPC